MRHLVPVITALVWYLMLELFGLCLQLVKPVCSAAIKSSRGWLILFGPQTDRTEEADSTATHGDWIGNPAGSVVGPRRKKRTARVRARTEPASRGCV